MSLFFESALPPPPLSSSSSLSDTSTIHVCISWHSKFPLIAVGSYSESRGGYVSIYDDVDSKLTIQDRNIPSHPTAQASVLAWHPVKKVLAVGWDNGDITINGSNAESFHQAGINLLTWSAKGTRLISTDRSGTVVGWEYISSRLQVVFHHELKDPLVGLCFHSSSSSSSGVDDDYDYDNGDDDDDDDDETNVKDHFTVSRDERASNLFTDRNWKRTSGKSEENLNSYAGSVSGVIYYLNENGSCVEVLQADGAVKRLLHQSKVLVVVTENMVIGQFSTVSGSEGNLAELSKVKMSTSSSSAKESRIAWCGIGILAVSGGGGDLSVRIWNLNNDDNYVLSSSLSSSSSSSFISALAFSFSKRLLVAGTNSGDVYMWKYDEGIVRGVRETDWRILPKINVSSTTIKDVGFGSVDDLLAVNGVRQVFILNEYPISAHYCDGMSAIQTGPTKIRLSPLKDGSSVECNASIQIRGCFLGEKTIVLWGNKRIIVFEIQIETGHLLKVGEFVCKCWKLVGYEKNLYTMEEDDTSINVRSFQGTIKQTLVFEEEGRPKCMSLMKDYLIVGTDKGFIKIWDLSKREARPHAHPIHLKDNLDNFQEIEEVKCNSKATYFSILYRNTEQNEIDSKLYFVEVESNSFRYFDFALKDRGDKDGNDSSLSYRNVVSHEWDSREPHLLVCFCQDGSNIVSLFVHEDFGIVVHDVTAVPRAIRLLAADIPYIVVIRENEGELREICVDKPVMKDFSGLETSDKATRDAVIRFSFHLSVGNMDEAFKSIKAVKNPQVWRNLAKMCVKTQRLDVAAICLGNMGHAYAARAVRLRGENDDDDLDVRTAYLAVDLDMLDEAERLFRKSGRYDLLNQLYQDSNRWNESLEIAEERDRIHRRTTYYNYAQHLESHGDIGGAIRYYERSDTHRFEIPRLLFNDDDVTLLENYIVKSNDKVLNRWWAQYMESTGEMETALRFYEMAEDYLSLVRVYCYCDDIERAAEIARDDRAACYHLARQYENVVNDVNRAIHFYTRAGVVSNAIRLCKEHGLFDQLWTLAATNDKSANDKLDAARYFETEEMYDKAVILYAQSGYLGKALDLAFKTNQHNVLHYISSNLNESADPKLVQKMADFFLESKQFEKAVDLFAACGQPEKALDLCLNYNITVTEDLESKLSRFLLDEKSSESKSDSKKKEILNQLAEVCYRQGNYQAAAKKWTQAGNRLQAMKALLKSGDTEKIIFFANVSREPDIYILAGNYLQTLDWRNNADIMKHIITFYTKSKAFDMLAWFYGACADVEIDEYRNYNKALSALTESLKCLKRDEYESHYERQIRDISRSMDLISRFVEIRTSIYDRDGRQDAAIDACKDLLTIPDINASIRIGDIYAFMIEHYCRIRQFKTAYSLVEELKTRISNVELSYFISSESLKSIDSAMGTHYMND